MHRMVALLILFLIVPAATASAKQAGPTEKVTITGPTIQGAIEVTHRDDLARLDIARLKGDPATPPSPDGSIYLLSYYARHSSNPDDPLAVTDIAHYDADPAGGRGYLYQDGWFQISADGEAVLQRLLQGSASQGKPVQPLPPTGLPNRTGIVSVGLIGLLALLGGVFLHHQHSKPLHRSYQCRLNTYGMAGEVRRGLRPHHPTKREGISRIRYNLSRDETIFGGAVPSLVFIVWGCAHAELPLGRGKQKRLVHTSSG